MYRQSRTATSSFRIFPAGAPSPTRKRCARIRPRTRAASSALIAMPYVRGSHAAGKLSLAFWDHWVPGANNTATALVQEWGAKEKVEVVVDYIPTQGQKLLLTIAAESQAQSGHDIIALSTWLASDHANQLEPVDDVVEPLIRQNGAVNATVEYLGKSE